MDNIKSKKNNVIKLADLKEVKKNVNISGDKREIQLGCWCEKQNQKAHWAVGHTMAS